MFVEGAFDADLDVVEVDEYRDIETILMRQNVFPGDNAVNANPDLRAGSSRNCSSRVFRSARVGRRQVTCRAIVPQVARGSGISSETRGTLGETLVSRRVQRSIPVLSVRWYLRKRA
jgi:hypothetical protein